MQFCRNAKAEAHNFSASQALIPGLNICLPKGLESRAGNFEQQAGN
jgi:hypothetical protein